MQIVSPLTGLSNVQLEKEISCDWLIREYERQLGADVQPYFHGQGAIQLYRCRDTGFRFYYPFDVDGDAAFYVALQRHPWYYTDWKWEHQTAFELIEPTDKVLEIGCARGSFVEYLRHSGIECVGLELNGSAAQTAQAKGLPVMRQSIQDHSEERNAFYDVVCAFQVVEHIAAIREFMQAAIDVLKPGGRFIISVPNNLPDSPILKDNILDMPPHHMGLWDSVALANLQWIFPIRLEQLRLEPCHHLYPYHSILQNKFVEVWGRKGKFVNRYLHQIQWFVLRILSDYLLGHTILAQYRKL